MSSHDTCNHSDLRRLDFVNEVSSETSTGGLGFTSMSLTGSRRFVNGTSNNRLNHKPISTEDASISHLTGNLGVKICCFFSIQT